MSYTVRGLFSAANVVFGMALLAGPAYGQSVTVQQVEAFTNSPTNTNYAPVNFNGSATATSGSYPGITFHAQANTTDTVSGHAGDVANSFYGSASVAPPYVTTVYAQSANNFLNGLNVQLDNGPSQPLPSGIGNGVRVSNHSYVGGSGNAMIEENIIRRIDYVVHSEDVVFVAGAVTGAGVFTNNNLVWASRNALSVRGDSAGSPFNPTANTITAGKQRADVWSDDLSSYATGRVSGFATALIGQATSLGLANATRNQVVRSLVLTGADKSAVGSVTGPWTRDTANNLSTTLGAGKANYAQSLSILQSGERAIQTVSGGTTANVVSSSLKGFAFGTSTTGQQAIVINAPNGISTLTATLVWNVTQQTTGGVSIDTSDAGRVFANLALELRTATFSNGQYVLGAAALSQTGLSSDAALDNAEHLYFNGSGGSLPPGTYAFVITGDPSRIAEIGFSYNVVPVPEPVGCLALLPVALLFLKRRRPQVSVSLRVAAV